MDYQKRLMDLLDQCQHTWVQLQSNKDLASIHSRKELREVIKQLVQLQDDFDDIKTTDGSTQWEEQAQALLQQASERVGPILQGCHGNDPVELSNGKPPASEPATTTTTETAKTNLFSSPFSQSRFNIARPSPSSSTPWSSRLREDEMVREFQTLSTKDQSPAPSSEPTHQSTEAESTASELVSPPIKLTKSNSSLSMYSLPSNVIDAPSPPQSRPMVNHSFTADEFRPEPRSKLTLSLPFKSLNSSFSTPVPGALAQINFYKDDREGGQSFASDAIVDHPLRIGVGYGSYICYNCTVFSNKGTPITIRKRYSDFVNMRQQLIKLYPPMASSIPKLPPKKIVKKFDPAFVEQRRRELEYFFKYIVLHPTLGSTSAVKQWIAP
ncbi:hypothetical protein [Absidia glauca]|uniref:Endosomal/vacuolar adapter protein YPT35 n=1 Tax=Absidia glauca TaxID=4829 RepID=A0A163JLJ2_ABSGL|nr:hypothetical protein [Absidia glauca]